MASRSPSTLSEGEIIESDSDKATTSPPRNGTSVDRRSRKRVSVSRSSSPIRAPGHSLARSRSRSPYREPRGVKRSHEANHYVDRDGDDPRRFRVHYEERRESFTQDLRKPPDDRDRSDQLLRFDQKGTGRRNVTERARPKIRSPPPSLGKRRYSGEWFGRGQGGRSNDQRPSPFRSDVSLRGINNKPLEQSVSDRGRSSVAAAYKMHEAETIVNQARDSDKSIAQSDHVPLRSDIEKNKAASRQPEYPMDNRIIDEATLIEERRKRREAIKAKYKSHPTPMLVRALALSNGSRENLSESSNISGLAISLGRVLEASSTMDTHTSIGYPQASPPGTPKDLSGQESPFAFVFDDNNDLANSGMAPNHGQREVEPSAADYDPTGDMQEDKLRYERRRQEDEMTSSAYEETAATRQDVLLPEPDIAKPIAKLRDNDFDMFADEDGTDMFADAPTMNQVGEESAKAVPIPQAKALDMSMLDDWDDQEGYYKIILGELLDNRYHVQSNLGKGMFSGVVRATDQKTNRLVAIKLIRNNETMRKAGLKEIDILHKLLQADADDKKHMIRLERSFDHKGHLCMVFENMSINLREVLKKFGRDVGINLKAVRAYAQQMFLGLNLLRKCNILHADLKPDNVLVNESRNSLKICDLGSASDASENEITPYLVSRFYRAPEIILGMPYDFAIDTWSIGCTLFELFTGKILFTGRNNNQMLRSIMECRGKFSHKILRKAEFAGRHFDDLLNFRSVEKDSLTGKDVVRILNFTKPTRDLRTRLLANAKGMNDLELKDLNMFIDLLDRCLTLNPEKRCTPNEALKHPFIMRTKA